MKKVQIDKAEFQWPESYQELDFSTRIEVAKLATGLTAFSGADSVLVWREIFKQICMSTWKSKQRSFRKWWWRLQVSYEQFEELCKLTIWVSEKPQGQPFDYFDYLGERYYVLPERFENVSAAEWVECIMDFIALANEDNSSTGLDILISNFCRPPREDLQDFKRSDKWNGDIREVYNRQKAIERAELLKNLDAGIKIQLLWWYETQITSFFEEFEDLFTGGAGEPRYPDGRGYLVLLKNVAKQGYMGNFETVCNTDVITVFAMLSDEVYDALEMEERLKNNGK